MKTILKALAALGLTSLPVLAHAALVDRGGGMFYDTDRNITWLANANAGAGSVFDDGPSTTDGRMTWGGATAWADALVVSGYDNWRLPTAEPNCSYLWPCNYGEIGHLFFDELGATLGSSVFDVVDTANLDLFSNVTDYVYWTSLTVNSYPAYDPGAMGFAFSSGTQSDFWQRNDFFAMAVRDGDVSPVPIPAAAWLFLSGIGGLGAMARRKRAT